MADIDAVVRELGGGQPKLRALGYSGDYVWPNAEGFDERNTFEKEVAYLKTWTG